MTVIGGGRTSDWAATELHDAGRTVDYVMRQTEQNHWKLISDSRMGLPYYERLARIMEREGGRFQPHYGSRVKSMETRGASCQVTIEGAGATRTIECDHVVVEIGGNVDYTILEGFREPLATVEKHDPYRFQCHQLPVHSHSYESRDIPNLYPGGYLAEGIGLVVIAMHGTSYAIVADILSKSASIN